MITTDPHEALAIAHERLRRLREDAAAERTRRAGGRRTLVASLRRRADRVDPAPFAPRPA